MKESLRKAGWLWMLLAALLLSGCSGETLTFDPQDLYSLPTLPAKYTELNSQLSAIQDGGAEYAAPVSGTNIQPIQLVDLDGDGWEEAVAFFRNAEDEKPLKIYIFTAKDDSYELTDLIEGSGAGIYSINYIDFNGDGRRELTVGWKATADQQVLEIYALRSGGAEALLRTNYVKYTTVDLDQDQRLELVVLQADETGEGVADYYNWQPDGSFASQSSARISATMAEISQQGRVTKGTLQNGIPAVFVTGVVEDAAWAITDILAAKNGALSNIVLSEVTGVSGEIAPYLSLYPTDINGDGLTEVPCPEHLPGLMEEESSYYQIEWRSYDDSGEGSVAMRTYHSTEDGWYLQLPEDWNDRIYVNRSAGADEAVVTFFILRDGKTEPFLRIAAITGSSRELKAVRGDRFLLARQSETIYTAELLDANDSWKYGITADEVREAFSTILPEWIAGDN